MASKVEVSVKASKETYELGQGLAKFVVAVKGALDDGWQLGQDLPVIVTAALSDLVPAMQGVEQISAELNEDPAEFYTAVALTAKSLADVWVVQPQDPQP